MTIESLADGLTAVAIGSSEYVPTLTPHVNEVQAGSLVAWLTESAELDPPAATTVAEVESLETTERGFIKYGEVRTVDGHLVRIQESSAASGPHVWLFQGEDGTDIKGEDTLVFDADGARTLRDALNAHVSTIPLRWGSSGDEENGDD